MCVCVCVVLHLVYLHMLLATSDSLLLLCSTQLDHAALYRRSDEYRFALHSIDYKFLLIPLFFVFLRLWSFIEDILYVFVGVHNLWEPLAVSLTLLGVSVLISLHGQ